MQCFANISGLFFTYIINHAFSANPGSADKLFACIIGLHSDTGPIVLCALVSTPYLHVIYTYRIKSVKSKPSGLILVVRD